MTLRISSELHAWLRDTAAASPDAEICGLLIGDGAIERITPTANVATNPRYAFEIDPVALFAAIRAERSGAGRIIGHYHSHPGGSARPSATDRANALVDGRVWIIIGHHALSAWIMTENGEFDAVELAIGD